MTKNVFIYVGHPKPGSLCQGLADAYENAASQAGANIRRLNLSDMRFDPGAFTGFDASTPLEPDLIAWQENITWADHLMFIHPYWWGGMPAVSKAVLDRALLPGFAFKFHDKGSGWDKLLKGKTGEGIITSDTPPLFDTLLYRKPGRRVLRNQVLGFCGVKVKKIHQFGPVKTSSTTKIDGWITKAAKMGANAAR